MHFYSSVRIGDIRHDAQPVKSRWLRRTLMHVCSHCGVRVEFTLNPQHCEVGQRQEVANAAALVMQELVKRLMEDSREVPWREIKVERDHDLAWMQDRLVASVTVPS